ncbi:Shikimate dehydrogenase [Rhodobacteraceae bacterium THAF1]|uniref:shikimate dehydrogenase n=1 Tax=Palleronia sp. THAF1 TaxID=2587842 RepID=UPI000F402E35|nr:shikimate dehydrogenase [Palleronia sp. THAF1]QFU10154.1 Shikimate dehydrogenase [Palleronia sp. THAF1]VDC16941.1 Shikimate dehydrogenase [Rhodobacteraceae bacterium THAF1]
MTDTIPVAAVLGHPIAHSRSPRVHGHWLARYGIAGHYVPLDVAPDNLGAVLAQMPSMGFVGCNVTLPHKEAALQIAHHVTDRAALIGAANTVTFRADGTIHADNTDGVGFIENLRQNAPDWRPRSGPAAVYGAGGAARAVVVALLDAGVPQIRIANRSRGRAEGLRQEFGSRLEVVDWSQAGNILDDAETVVNTTSLGMQGKPAFRVPLDGLRRGATVTDIVYTPLETPFLATAREAGCTCVDGLGMLLHQAVPGFERWFGQRPEVDDELRAVVLA